LRFYVVALLFIIFDVEVAFFFPWAVVFGKATQLSAEPPAAHAAQFVGARLQELGASEAMVAASVKAGNLQPAARGLALTSFADIAIFFFVLMVGFFYVWKRGDLDWVRVVAQERVQPLHRPPPPRAVEPSQSILSA
jgi:NADH-quinone oxidoreductase subunit A